MKENVFDGDGAILDFFNPARPHPLIRLPRHLNPLHDDSVVVYAKMCGENVKFTTVYNMLSRAREQGLLKGVDTWFENTSGNTAIAGHVLGPLFGIKEFVPLVAQDLAVGKSETIKRLGMAPITHKGDGIARAIALGKQPGCINLNQYANPSNTEAHYRWTGPQIFEQTDGKVRVVGIAVGTSGTLGGVLQFLQEKLGRENVTGVGAICDPNSMVPGVRSKKGLQEVSLPWESYGAKFMEVSTLNAYFISQRLSSNGISAGPSSGLAYRGLLDFLFTEKAIGRLDAYRDREGQIVAVFVCPDSPDKYWDKYGTISRPEFLSSGNSILE